MIGALTTLALAASTIAAPAAPSSDWKEHIKNVVVLVQENRSFDSVFGDLSYRKDIDNIRNLKGKDQYCNPANTSTTQTVQVCAAPVLGNVAPDDPNHTLTGVTYEVFNMYHPDESGNPKQVQKNENMLGFVVQQEVTYKDYNVTRASESINYLSEELIPVMRTMAENYVLFDQWHADVPGPTNPNRAYWTSGTSHGHGKNDAAFGVFGLPQRSIFQQLDENNVTWINYYNSSFKPDADFYTWTNTSGRAHTNVLPIAKFYSDAKAGTLPQFTYINPECCKYDSMHPPSPINRGEAWIKGVYDALRTSPQWNNTLFILSFDEHGGFADHVAPLVGVPPGDNLTYTEVAEDGKNYTFNFDRLGIRVPTILISPWVGQGELESKPQEGKYYSHSSLAAFLSKLWNLDDGTPLTPRVAGAASFEHLITNKFRDDAIAELPQPFGY